MNQKLWANAIDGIIPDGLSVQDFAIVTKVDQPAARKMLQELSTNEIGEFDGDNIIFKEGDKLRVAILALQNGVLIDEVAKHLDWRDFEGLASKVFESRDFTTTRNLILTKPRMEIDVIGLKFGIALLVDCKHWKKYSQSTLSDAVKKQIERTKHYVAKTNYVAAPVIVTLYQDKISFIDKVPIVPIFQFASFIDEFYGNLENVTTIKTENQ